jgi:large subunit ribosomal protein L25
MEEIKLDVQIRNEVGTRKIKRLRREDFIPAVVYGLNKAPTTIKVDRRVYEKIMRSHMGQSVVFHLNVMENGKKLRDYSAIVKDDQVDPVTDELNHIDFIRIDLDQDVEVTAQIVSKGEPKGVTEEGGSLDHVIWELDIVCLPKNIPEKIEVDVTELKIGDAIHVGDINLPEGVSTPHDPEAIVFSVVPPMKEEEAPAPGEEEEDVEPEVIKEKKAKDEEESDSEPEGESKSDEA